MDPGVEVLRMAPQQHEYNDGPFLLGPVDADLSSNDSAEGEDEVVTRPTENDVLLGRGGGINKHCGNIKFRKLVNKHKMRYLACSKIDKPNIAREVVQLWRAMLPPGRFLACLDDTKRGPGFVKIADSEWFEVGDKRARAKASQSLRERTPVMPYITLLREQHDAISDKGISMVQLLMHQQLPDQRQQRQQQAHSSPQGWTGFSPCVGTHAYSARHTSAPEHPPFMGPAQNMYSPERFNGAAADGASEMPPSRNDIALSHMARQNNYGGGAFCAPAPVMQGDIEQHMSMVQNHAQIQHMQMHQLQQQRTASSASHQHAMLASAYSPQQRQQLTHNLINVDPLIDLPTGIFHLELSHSNMSPVLPLHNDNNRASFVSKLSTVAPMHHRLPDRRRPTSASLRYCQILLKYIENPSNVCSHTNSNPAAIHHGGGASVAAYDKDEDDLASDLQDDWEKEREANRRADVVEQDNVKKNGRGVNRSVSGYSSFSGNTIKSGISMVTGFSAGMFSTDSTVRSLTQEQKMNAGCSVCSNLSLMSELTDLSGNIDKLGLDADY
jgi:hypothetical protein